MLARTNNQSKDKIVDIMSQKIYAHRHARTHVYTPSDDDDLNSRSINNNC